MMFSAHPNRVDELEAHVERLERRLGAVDDEREIADVLARYGRCADAGDHDGFVGLFTDDGVIELIGGTPALEDANPVRWEGKEQIRAFIDDPGLHMRIEGRCMHLPALESRTRVDGDGAVADTCSLVLVAEESTLRLYGAGFTRWELRRVAGKWRIARRTRLAVGAGGLSVALGASG